MRTMTTMAALGLSLLCGHAYGSKARDIPLEPDAWTTDGAMVTFETFAGRRALKLTDGEAGPAGVTLRDGVIAFDVAFEDTRGFAGVIFRRPDHRNGENFYLRSHQSGNPDANQYTPIHHGLSAWQIYYGPQYASPTEYRHGEWMRVEVIVRGDEAEVLLDGQPILHIADLLREPVTGGIALWTNIAPAWFSNVRVSDARPAFRLEPAPPPVMPPGTVREWQVSGEFEWARVASDERLDPGWLDDLTWTTLEVEANGIANLGRIADRARGPAVLARVTVPAEHAREFRFGFSDAVRAYVNGILVYAGDNTYATRDYRHLGTVGLYDTLYTPPSEVPVTFTFAVRESFGGWAIAGATPLAVPVRAEVTTLEGNLGQTLHELLSEFQRDGFSGALIAAEGGQAVLEAGYGLADHAADKPFTVDTVAQIGSITKPFTALAVANLVLEGELEFQDTAGSHLAGAAAPANGVTLHQLLTHSSGMPEYCGPDFEPLSREGLLKECMGQELRFEPGSQVAYSNPGYSVLGAVVEAASGQDLERYLRERLLESSGIGGIGYFPPAGSVIAHGYRNGQDQGVISERLAPMENDYWRLKGNGGMQASARDMFGLYEALAGRRSFPPLLVEIVTRPRERSGEANWNAYGWNVGLEEDGTISRVSHAGSDGVFFSYFWWDPLSDRFFYLVTNTGEERGIEAARGVLRTIRDAGAQ